MQSRECLRRVGSLLREQVPTEFGEFHWESFSLQSKLWYGNKALHYEIWSRQRLGTIEIGLHFEADPLTNARLLAAFTANAKSARRVLRAARIEEWDRGWARVWEPLPHRKPDQELANELADRIADYISVLEPILRRELPSDVAWSEPKAVAQGAKASAKSRAQRSSR